MPEVVSMVSAHVAPERVAEVVEGFGAAVRAGMPERRHTSLLRGEGGLMRIVTVWRSQDHLDRTWPASTSRSLSASWRARVVRPSSTSWNSSWTATPHGGPEPQPLPNTCHISISLFLVPYSAWWRDCS